MKYVAAIIAGLALAGCDITFGSNGPVITQSDSIIRQVVPIGNQTPPANAPAAADATAPTATSVQATSPRAPSEPRATFTLPPIGEVIALPVGIHRSKVNRFKTAVVNAGCVVSGRADQAAVQDQAGLDDDEVRLITSYLRRSGELEQMSGSYRLTSGPCADA